jgi:hypothetical protein
MRRGLGTRRRKSRWEECVSITGVDRRFMGLSCCLFWKLPPDCHRDVLSTFRDRSECRVHQLGRFSISVGEFVGVDA